jgi:CRP-like cAMP-binding protein
LNRGEFFFHQGEPATSYYVIAEGQTRLSQITDDGRQVIFHYFGPGDAMGVVVVLANADYPVSAEAITDTIALGWDRTIALSLIEQYPRLAINGMELVASRFWELQNRYRELATERVEQRLARAITRLSEKFGYLANGKSPTLKLSRQDLAEMTGTTLFTVSRICSDWETRSILATGREQITVLNHDELQQIAKDLPNS